MPRPQTKQELLSASQDGMIKLNSLIDGFSRQEKYGEFPFPHRDRNIRDVLAHLHEWHLMMLTWYEIGMGGGQPEMPAPGFTWKTTPALNAKIWNKYQRHSLTKVRRLLASSHEDLVQVIERHSDNELFQKRLYGWTGSTSLGSYLVSSTSSHYAWAFKILRKYEKSLG